MIYSMKKALQSKIDNARTYEQWKEAAIVYDEHKGMHLKVLSSLSSMVGDERIRTRIISAMNPEDAMEVIESKEARDYNYFLD